MDGPVHGRLVLEDGYTLVGRSFGAPVSTAGEMVFTTSMVGYPESRTDPSYRGQILTLTFPSIGNYGVPAADSGPLGLPRTLESDRIQVSGLVVADYSPAYSHWEAVRSLSDWLRAAGVPALCDVDTRALTRRLRERGTMLGRLELADEEVAWPLDDDSPHPAALDLIRDRRIELVINIPKNLADSELTNGYLIRRHAVDFGIPLLTNLQAANLLVDALAQHRQHGLECLPWEEYVG